MRDHACAAVRLFAPTKTPRYAPAAYPVPDTESLRLAALEKSRRRGRRVARRRVALRWLGWLFTRYILPLAVTLGLFYLGWLHFGSHPVVPSGATGQPPLTLKPENSLHLKEIP